MEGPLEPWRGLLPTFSNLREPPPLCCPLTVPYHRCPGKVCNRKVPKLQEIRHSRATELTSNLMSRPTERRVNGHFKGTDTPRVMVVNGSAKPLRLRRHVQLLVKLNALLQKAGVLLRPDVKIERAGGGIHRLAIAI
jgi:hypothetical protein